MIKNEMQIERDFYVMVKSSALGTTIRGDVYRSEMRPYDAKSEDIVIKFLAGLDEQIQSGIVIVNVYVPDVKFGKSGRKVANKERIEELQSLIADLIHNNANTEYQMQSDATPTTMQEENIEQHIINVRIKFKRLS